MGLICLILQNWGAAELSLIGCLIAMLKNSQSRESAGGFVFRVVVSPQFQGLCFNLKTILAFLRNKPLDPASTLFLISMLE